MQLADRLSDESIADEDGFRCRQERFPLVHKSIDATAAAMGQLMSDFSQLGLDRYEVALK